MDKLPKEVHDFAKQSLTEVGRSAMFLSLVTPSYFDDPWCMIQMGAALLLDKPILLMVEEGQKVPENLKKVAADIEFFKAGDQADLERATARLCEKGTALCEAAEKFKAQHGA